MLGLVTKKNHDYVFDFLCKQIEILRHDIDKLKAALSEKLDGNAIAECEDCGRLIYAVNGADRGVEAVRDGAGGYSIRDKYACESCEEIRIEAKHLAADIVDAALVDALGLDDEAPEATLYDADGWGGRASDSVVMPCGAQKADVDDGK